MESPVAAGPLGPSSSVRYAVGDALRATAIVFVLTSHTFYFTSPRLVQREIGTALGDWGVAAFFVLSGFLLGRPYVDAILGRRPAPVARVFAARRFLRIWPAYAVMVVCNALISGFHHSKHAVSVGDVAAHLLLVHNFFVHYLSGLDAPYWTLAVEAQFYVAMPLIAYALMAIGERRPQQRAMLLWGTIVVTIVLCLTWRIATTLSIALTEPDLCFVWYRNLIGMSICFALGATVATFESDGRVLSQRIAASSFAVGIFLLGAMIPTGIIFGEARVVKLLLDVLGSVSATAILLGCLHVRWTRLSAFVKSRSASAIATNSYALYLTHYTVLSLLTTALRAVVHNLAVLEFTIIASFLAIAPLVAAAYRRFVEVPFLRLKQEIREPRPLSTGAAATMAPSPITL